MNYLLPLALMVLSLASCQKLNHIHEKDKVTPREAYNQVLPHANSSVKSQLSILRNRGILTTARGDELLFILPTDRFFKGYTDRLRTDNMGTLNELAKVLKALGDGPLVITGHTDAIGATGHKNNLSLRRARRISSYFWGTGIPYDRMATRGFGDMEAISPHSVSGDGMNRRVEIRVRRTGFNADPLAMLTLA